MYNFDWIPNTNRINPNSSINDIKRNIASCKYFIGVTSGMICMAQNILGDDRCIHLNKWGKPLNYFFKNNIQNVWPISDDKLQKAINNLEK